MRNIPAIRLLLIVLEIIIVQAAQAQPSGSNEANTIIKQLRSGIADTQRVQMLQRLSTFYLKKTLNPVSDMDSALLLAGQALDLAQRLKFASGEEDAIFLRGKIYIKQQNKGKVQQMLPDVSSKNRIKLLLELGKSMLRTTYLQEGDRDSAIFFFLEAGRLSDEIGNQKLKEESQCLLGVVYLLNDNWRQGKAYFVQVIEARQRAKDKAGELNALLRFATAAFCDNCAENITALNRALELSLQIRDQPLEAIIRLQLGYKYLNDGKNREAEEQALAALKVQNAIGYPALFHTYKSWAEECDYSISDYEYLSNAYYLLSDLGQIKGDLSQKLFYILKVVDEGEKGRMVEELAYTYFRLGNAYWELGQFDKSIWYHKLSISISRQKGELINVEIARRMAVALIKQGKSREALLLLHEIIDKKLLCDLEDKMYLAQSLGSCYNALKQYTTAEKYYIESVAWSKQLPLRFQFVASQGISEFYIANAQYSRAEPYLSLLLNASSQQILPNYLKEVHLMWFKLDSARQNYPEAIRHYQQYKALQDSIYNETKSRQISQLSIQYETETKDKNIELLVQKDKVQQATLRQSATMRKITLAGILVLLVITGLVYNQYRNKQRTNKKINEKNLALEQLVRDKEWLVKEIHHRVKNNFHIVASLLEIQTSYLKNKEALSAIRDSQHRIHSMSIIHQKLYQSENLSTIHMPEYIYELVEYLRESYAIRENIGFSLQIENIELNHASAITLGLILNEAITNAIKYAFAKNQDGKIAISLSHISDSQLLLSIADNGRGLPVDFDSKIGSSMGMELLQGLTDDLGGSFSIETNEGTHIKVIFDYKPLPAANVSFT